MKAEIGKQSLEWHVGTREQGEEGNAWHFFKALRIHFLHIKVFFGGGEGRGRVTDITMSNLGN